MKVIIFLNTLFLLTECFKNLAELRYKSELTWNQIQNVMDMSFVDMYDVIKKEFKKNKYSFNVSATEMKSEKLKTVRNNLKNLGRLFMDRSFGYILKKMHYYCQLAIELIKKMVNEVSNEEIIKTIRLTSDQDHCVFTFLYDYGVYDVGNALEALMYLKHFTETDLDLIKKKIERLIFNIKSYKLDENIEHEIYGEQLLEENTKQSRTFLEYQSVLMEIIKNEINLISNRFCNATGSPLIIGYDMFGTAEVESDFFMQYVFVAEVCNVNFVNVDDDSALFSEKLRIESWDCSNILLNEFSSTKDDGAKWEWRNEVSDTSEGTYNLAALQSKLKTDRHYLNIVQYDNIVADVILYVALKEGYKIMKAMKYLTIHSYLSNTKCQYTFQCEIDENFYCTELKIARTSLSIFKYHIDVLINMMLHNKRIDLSGNPDLIKFIGSATELLRKLDYTKDEYSKNETIEKKCQIVEEEIFKIPKEAEPAHVRKFRTFHMHNPVVYIRRLNHYLSNI
ncbi:Hypothetical protein CINCED_3A010289 [Cinara cedri]|uniref:Uncharacterized protein n=1 Tax=Cinara cedri TaxID=506608 RepID=A0A5E4MIZ4_9HEMI|nr:Hypothetical protein CINCED_3A010289 [Cinara cedri]